jgi:hypothetical protein
MPYNHDYSEDVERRSDAMKRPINWVNMSTFDCLNKTKRHCSLINLIVMIISDWLTLADKALINVSPTLITHSQKKSRLRSIENYNIGFLKMVINYIPPNEL